jgi:hypothetical protein
MIAKMNACSGAATKNRMVQQLLLIECHLLSIYKCSTCICLAGKYAALFHCFNYGKDMIDGET